MSFLELFSSPFENFYINSLPFSRENGVGYKDVLAMTTLAALGTSLFFFGPAAAASNFLAKPVLAATTAGSKGALISGLTFIAAASAYTLVGMSKVVRDFYNNSEYPLLINHQNISEPSNLTKAFSHFTATITAVFSTLSVGCFAHIATGISYATGSLLFKGFCAASAATSAAANYILCNNFTTSANYWESLYLSKSPGTSKDTGEEDQKIQPQQPQFI